MGIEVTAVSTKPWGAEPSQVEGAFGGRAGKQPVAAVPLPPASLPPASLPAAPAAPPALPPARPPSPSAPLPAAPAPPAAAPVPDPLPVPSSSPLHASQTMDEATSAVRAAPREIPIGRRYRTFGHEGRPPVSGVFVAWGRGRGRAGTPPPPGAAPSGLGGSALVPGGASAGGRATAALTSQTAHSDGTRDADPSSPPLPPWARPRPPPRGSAQSPPSALRSPHAWKCRCCALGPTTKPGELRLVGCLHGSRFRGL